MHHFIRPVKGTPVKLVTWREILGDTTESDCYAIFDGEDNITETIFDQAIDQMKQVAPSLVDNYQDAYSVDDDDNPQICVEDDDEIFRSFLVLAMNAYAKAQYLDDAEEEPGDDE